MGGPCYTVVLAAGHYWGSISTDSTCESVESADVVVAVGAVSGTHAKSACWKISCCMCSCIQGLQCCRLTCKHVLT